jgi:hypothetical protein
MAKVNCWEFKKCGRQAGGPKVSELGLCPASTETRVDGVNHGSNAGRSCWYVAGTLCGGKVQGVFATKLVNCRNCEFYQSVAQEEGRDLAKASDVLAKLV